MSKRIHAVVLMFLLFSCYKDPIEEAADSREVIIDQGDTTINEDENEPRYYFPSGNDWETVSPDSLAWNTDSLEYLLDFIEEKNTYGFIVLHKGRIVTENYWNGWDNKTPYVVASAGKSVTAFLVGLAQQRQWLSISDAVSKHLGNNWTSEPLEKENKISIHHLLSMTSGLNEEGDQCMDTTCLAYKADAGTRWAYHSGAYNFLNVILEKVSKKSIDELTKQLLSDEIGLEHGKWENHILHLSTRDMARFGLLILNKGIWNGKQLLSDSTYYWQMISPSNEFNQAYGYLWWLNGQKNFMISGDEKIYEGSLVPTAPADMFAAMGRGDKKIYIVPSLDLVVVRHGNDTGTNAMGPSSFDTELWKRLKQIIRY